MPIAGAVGCGGNKGGDTSPGDAAYLTIVGDDDVFAEAGARRTLVVRYHDESDRPLAGTVTFRIEGDSAGAELAASSVVTDADGKASVDLEFGLEGESAFQVHAEAPEASPVFWRASVAAPPLGVAGKYRLESRFRTPDGLPDGEAEGLQTFLELTDDPYDPATWILDYIENQLDDPLDDVLAVARQGFALDQELYNFLADHTPALLLTIKDVGDGLAEVSENLGLASRLELSENQIESGTLQAEHRVTGAIFWLGGDRYDYSAAQMGLSWDAVGEVGVGVLEQQRQLEIGTHTLYLPYGELLVHALDNVVVPSIDPLSGSMVELVAAEMDCEGIGQEIADELDLGAPGVFEAACVAGLGAAIGAVTDEIEKIEADLVLSGEADLVDGDRDFEVEKLSGGEWEGEMIFGAGSMPLSRPDQRFSGTRVGLGGEE